MTFALDSVSRSKRVTSRNTGALSTLRVRTPRCHLQRGDLPHPLRQCGSPPRPSEFGGFFLTSFSFVLESSFARWSQVAWYQESSFSG